MSYQVISSFQGGLDARKFFLSLPPGTLTKLINGHITQGGEIEKRKLFSPLPLPSGTFGEQETTAGIVVFGSTNFQPWAGSETIVAGSGNAATASLVVSGAGTWVPAPGDPIQVAGSGDPNVNGIFTVLTYIAGALSYSVPNAASYFMAEATTVTPYFAPPVIYQQLTHPIAGVTMTGAVSSTYFAGTPQIITTWSNGDVLVFDGSVVETDFYIGSQCNITPTPFAMAGSLVTEANATGRYTGVAPVLPSSLTFTVTAGTSSPGVNKVLSVNYNFGRLVKTPDGTTANIFTLASNVDWATSNVQTAANLVTAINTNPYGFTAANGGTNTVTITPPATDFYGNPLGVNASDSLLVYPAGNVQIYNPGINPAFNLFSIPSTNSANPYGVNSTTENATANSQLISSGVAAILPANAAGQFGITQGIDNIHATGTLTYSAGIPANNQTVTVGGVVYTFVNFLTNLANQVLIAGNGAATFQNLIYAINAGTGSGSNYSSNTNVNPSASASAIGGGVSTVTALAAGVPGNSVALVSTATGIAASAATLTGGTNVNTISQITVGAVNLLPGVVPFNSSVNQTAADVVTAINGFQGTSGFSATANANVITVTSVLPGTSPNQATLSVICANGVCIANCNFAVAGTAGQNISSITFNGGSNILTATITFQDGGHPTETMAQFCGRVAANINAHSGTSLVVAANSGNQVWLSNQTAASTDNAPVVVTTNTLTVAPATTTALSAVGNVSSIPFTSVPGQSSAKYTVGYPNSAVVTAQGGSPPYSYAWAVIPGGNALGAAAQVTSQNNQWWKIFLGKLGYPSGQDNWQCTVTDSLGNKSQVNFLVYN